MKNDFTYHLIKSLTIGEKRTFKQIANYAKTNDKQYLALFFILDSLTTYNEEEIVSKLKKQKINTPITTLNFYLQESILKTLRFSKKGIDSKIMELIDYAEILHQKGFEKNRDLLLEKAKKIAIKHERFSLLIEIQNKEWFYQPVYNAKDVIEIKKSLDLFGKIIEYRDLNFLKVNLQTSGEIRDENLLNNWENLFGKINKIENKKFESYETKYHKYQILMRYYFRKRNYLECLDCQEKVVNHLESKKEILALYKEIYMFELNGLIVANIQLEKYECADIPYTKLKKINNWELTTKEREVLNNILTLVYSNLIHAHFISNNFEKILKIAEEAENFITTNNIISVYKGFIYLNLAKVNIYNGNYHTALKWNNKIINTSKEERREDIFVLSKLFNLIIHFELENYDLIQSITRSTANFLEEKKQLFETEKVILNYLKNKFPKAKTKKETYSIFVLMRNELAEVKKDPFEAKVFDYFDYIAWLDSKIEQKSLIKIATSKKES